MRLYYFNHRELQNRSAAPISKIHSRAVNGNKQVNNSPISKKNAEFQFIYTINYFYFIPTFSELISFPYMWQIKSSTVEWG